MQAPAFTENGDDFGIHSAYLNIAETGQSPKYNVDRDIGLHRGRDVIHSDTPAAGQALRLRRRPEFEDVEAPEGKECNSIAEQRVRHEQERDEHPGPFVDNDFFGIMAPEFFSPAGQINRKNRNTDCQSDCKCQSGSGISYSI